jgi:hypothetical protein
LRAYWLLIGFILLQSIQIVQFRQDFYANAMSLFQHFGCGFAALSLCVLREPPFPPRSIEASFRLRACIGTRNLGAAFLCLFVAISPKFLCGLCARYLSLRLNIHTSLSDIPSLEFVSDFGFGRKTK